MEPQFCDICNESVPEADLSKGRAFVRKGRVICVTCDAAMSSGGREEDTRQAPGAVGSGAVGSGPERPGHRRSGSGRSGSGRSGAPVPGRVPSGGLGAGGAAAPVVTTPRSEAVRGAAPPATGSGLFFASSLASIAILFTAGVLLLMKERMDKLEDQGAASYHALRDELSHTARSLESEVEAARSFSFEELDGVAQDVSQMRRELRLEAEDRASRRSELVGRVEDLSDRFTALEARVRDAERGRGGLADVQSDMAALDEELRRVGARVRQLEDGAVLAAVAPLPEGARPPAWQGLTLDLESENAGTRWSAVQALGETGDPAVVPYLIPKLDDADIFVRMAAARILGDLRALVAIGELIETLDDEEPSVREAAVVTLRALTGRNFRFDPTASASERQRRVDSWRDWWEENRDELVGEAGAS